MALNCYSGRKERVGAVYRRISDEYLDPMNFREDSVIGIPHIYDIYRKGNVALMNAPGNGVADDKGIYYFVPKMVKYYLGEEPILQNAPTYLPFYADDMQYTLEHFDDLVLKDVAEAGCVSRMQKKAVSVFGYRFSIWMILFNRQTAGRDRPRSFCPAGAECPRPCPRSWTRERASRRRRRRWRAVPRRCRRGPDRNCVRRTCRT